MMPAVHTRRAGACNRAQVASSSPRCCRRHFRACVKQDACPHTHRAALGALRPVLNHLKLTRVKGWSEPCVWRRLGARKGVGEGTYSQFWLGSLSRWPPLSPGGAARSCPPAASRPRPPAGSGGRQGRAQRAALAMREQQVAVACKASRGGRCVMVVGSAPHATAAHKSSAGLPRCLRQQPPGRPAPPLPLPLQLRWAQRSPHQRAAAYRQRAPLLLQQQGPQGPQLPPPSPHRLPWSAGRQGGSAGDFGVRPASCHLPPAHRRPKRVASSDTLQAAPCIVASCAPLQLRLGPCKRQSPLRSWRCAPCCSCWRRNPYLRLRLLRLESWQC